MKSNPADDRYLTTLIDLRTEVEKVLHALLSA